MRRCPVTTHGPNTSIATADITQHGEALLGELPPGTRTAEVTVRGATTHVFYRMNDAEHRRRQTCGAAPLGRKHRNPSTDLALFRLLLNLPTGMPVPLKTLTTRERTLLRRCPTGAVSVEHGSVERLAVPRQLVRIPFDFPN
jgi:hypothetical protein